MSEAAPIVGAQQFLRTMPAPYIGRLAAIATHITLPAGHRLFEEGGPADKFWLIDAGQVSVDVLIPGDGKVTIERLGRGDVLGLSWLQPPYRWQYGAITTQPMQAFEFDARDVRAMCERDPAFGYAVVKRFMAVAARRLQATRARLTTARAAA
jgi:CRP/FNR family transcriptional regulator, cyclic AMP receptor protein